MHAVRIALCVSRIAYIADCRRQVLGGLIRESYLDAGCWMLVLCGLGELTDLGVAILDAWVFKDIAFSGRNSDFRENNRQKAGKNRN